MPAYTYECEKCGNAFDVRRSMTDDSTVVCVTCRSKRVRRVYQALAMVGASASGATGSQTYDAGSSCSSPGACGCC